MRRGRLAQVRICSAFVREATRLGPVESLVGRIRKWPILRTFVDSLAGFNRVFPDLEAAKAVAAGYAQHSHDSQENVSAQRRLSMTTRPSDYPALLHLSRLPLDDLRVFDLGGAMGNMFFLYNRCLEFPASLRWTVHDLPGHMERGRQVAREQNESRIRFTDDPQEATGHDVLLVSGSLHYFDFTLAAFLNGLDRRPRHVIVNRTPLVNAPTAATVQSAHGVMVGCKLLNRAELIAQMESEGYRVVDSWSAPEFSIKLPYDPDYAVKEYSGIYFRLISGS